MARLHLPVTAWGERVGVLSVGLDAERVPPRPGRAARTSPTRSRWRSAADRGTDRYRLARRRRAADDGRRDAVGPAARPRLRPATAFQLAGQLEPAYAVGGDHFDWSSDGERLTVTALNGEGSGLDAALLTTLTVNAMRNARRSIRPARAPGDLVDQADAGRGPVSSQYGGRRATWRPCCCRWTLVTGGLRVGRRRLARHAAGPQRARSSDMVLDPQLPLGMFGDTRYVEEREQLRPATGSSWSATGCTPPPGRTRPRTVSAS